MNIRILITLWMALSAVGTLSVANAEEEPIKVCGTVYQDEEIKGIYEKSSKTYYDLVINEVAEPSGLTLHLINYQSAVYQALNEGQSLCALGVLGFAPDNSAANEKLIKSLVNWVVIGE